ncbi:uncharacterized protein LOC119606265 [Lucilia sericata]|uniref:uncharacterized protein LOC119606265 n=1 Tax=Lucilia sericata TaxID=13632 RepID=UPI0018A875A6|nr:uncharacterized protein LOC119606265 [Lucilia sericata]
MFIKNFKLFAICVLGLNMYAQARSVSVSQVGDVNIARSGDNWTCDRIECPMSAYRCFVSKSNEDDPSVLTRVNACFTKDNRLIAHEAFYSHADPKSRIRVQVTSTRNGNIVSSTNGLENYDEEKVNAHIQGEMNKMQANVNAQMENLHANLHSMNENINANIQNQMQDFHRYLN